VPTADFLFSMRLTGEDQLGTIMGDLAANVFQQAGCPPDAVAELVRDLGGVVMPDARSRGHVDLQFRAAAGSCEVIVSVDDREVWRTSRRIP
jgi:hypothetical protein